MKHFVAVLISLVLISCSDLKSSGVIDQESSHTKIDQLAERESKPDVSRGEPSHSAFLAALDSRRPDSVSPYEIKRYVDQHKSDEYVSLAEYWKRLRIDIEEWQKYGKCEVAIFEVEPGSGEAADIMLRLYDQSGWSMGGTRYLLFKPISVANETEWKLLGHIDLQDQRYAEPQHRFIASGPAHWLVLTILAGRGSGYCLYYDEWYEIDDNGVKLVLSYPSNKFLSWRDPIPVLEASSEVTSATTESDRTSLVIDFTASYCFVFRCSQ
jgi:hypothetical protein